MVIQKATDHELNDIVNVNMKAFGDEGSEVVRLVKDALVDPSAMPALNLIAVENNRTVGHILFTKARLLESKRPVSVSLLAPLAVVPDYQSRGIGSKLIKEGLSILYQLNVELVFVLGHPDYYPRSGFTPAGVNGFEAPFPIPEKNAGAWMVQELHPGAIQKVSGRVMCCDSIYKPEYWRE